MAIEGLGILIPTWDRPDEVRLRLREIADQFGPDQRVHIQVNPGRHGLTDIGALNSTGEPVSGSMNEANMGFVANIVIGLERLRESEWVWILGDDDRLSPDCAALIEKGLRTSANDAFAVHYDQWPHHSSEPSSVADSMDLLARVGISSLLFISATVWRRRYFIEHISLFIDQAFSCSSQVALLLEGLKGSERSMLVFSQPLIDYQRVHRWSRVTYLQRMGTLLKHDLPGPVRKRLARILYPQWQWAVDSAWQEVESGSVTYRTWLLGSARAWLTIQMHAPSAWFRPTLASMQQELNRRKRIWRNRITSAGRLAKQRLRG